MLARRAAIAVLALVCLAGCASSGWRQAPTPLIASGPPIEHPLPSEQSPRTFTIVFSTFIPSNHVNGPRIHPQSYSGLLPPRRLTFAGDDRGFDVDATAFRSRQTVTVVPDAAEDADGLLEGSQQNLGGRTESFVASQTLANGRIDDGDRDGVLGDGRLKQAEAAASAQGMIIEGPVRLGPHTVWVGLKTARSGGPRNELVFGAPSIDWDIGITIDTSGPEPSYEVVGSWDGYPAAELYINRQPVFLFTPGNAPGRFVDLLKLLPGYADRRFARRGTLGGTVATTHSGEMPIQDRPR